MPQTVSSVSHRAQVIEVSVNGTTWTDISGSTSQVEDFEQERESGEAYTADGDTGIIQSGKRKPLEIKYKIVYTEQVTEAFEVVRAAFEASTPLYARHAPRGTGTGLARYTTAAGIVTAFTYPPFDAEDGKPVMAGFTLKTPSITRAVQA